MASREILNSPADIPSKIRIALEMHKSLKNDKGQPVISRETVRDVINEGFEQEGSNVSEYAFKLIENTGYNPSWVLWVERIVVKENNREYAEKLVEKGFSTKEWLDEKFK